MNAIILAIFGAFCLSFISALAIIKYATNTGKMLDKDEVKKPQKMHFGDIPRAGGVGIFVGFCAFVAILSTLGDIKDEYIYLLIPSCFIFLSGFWEDLNNSISPKMRLFMQTIGGTSAILLFQNCVITDIGFTLPYGFGVIFTLFCIVGVVNAINIIDGFNGLASGCAILMLASIAIVAYLVGNGDIFYIALIAIGAIVGFFVLNFPHGKIFLGDGGAYLVGFLLAFLLVTLTQNPQNLGENNAESRLDSANQNNPSLRADSQNLRGNPPCDYALFSQGGLLRSHSLARNDEILDSSLCSRSAQNDKSARVAESRLDSATHTAVSVPSTHEANSSIFDEKSGLCSCEREDRTDEFIDEASGKLPDLSQKDAEFANKSLKNAIFNSKVSAYYGLCIAIYPVFEVLFSIYRRKRRKLRAMSADNLHLHTLIFKRITRSSVKTSVLILTLNTPFIFTPIFLYDKTAILVALIALFIVIYIFLYMKIIRFKVGLL